MEIEENYKIRWILRVHQNNVFFMSVMLKRLRIMKSFLVMIAVVYIRQLKDFVMFQNRGTLVFWQSLINSIKRNVQDEHLASMPGVVNHHINNYYWVWRKVRNIKKSHDENKDYIKSNILVIYHLYQIYVYIMLIIITRLRRKSIANNSV